MRIAISKHGRSAIVAGLAAAGALMGPAAASVVRPTASLPLIDVPYISPTGAGCFTVAIVCVTPGPFVQTSATSSFDAAGQEIIANAVYGATLTLPPPAPDTPIGSVALHGTIDETVLGRTNDGELGTFATDITGLSLTGTLMLPPGNPLDGAPVFVTLDGTSEGKTTITAEGGLFRINSFFDVFVEISIPGATSPPVGPITLVAVPEPSTWAMLLTGFAGLGFAGWRRAAGLAG